jgi:TPR repeat protein
MSLIAALWWLAMWPSEASDSAATLMARGDFAGAASAFEITANAGSAVAQNNLGVLLLRGKGRPRDPQAARGWFEKAAAQNLPGAMYNLGMIYLRGYGVEVDRVKAAGWLEKSATLGDAEAQFYLGMLYFRGTAGGGNPAMAAHWFEQAAAKGVKEAQFNLALLLLEGKGIAADESRAISLLEALGDRHPDAELMLARAHLQHAPDESHVASALKLFRKLAENGRAEAQSALGMMYTTGTGLKQDAEEGRFWVNQAAFQNFGPAQRQMGDFYAAGLGVTRDLVESAAWYSLGASHGDSDASKRTAVVMKELTADEQLKMEAHVLALKARLRPGSAPRATPEAHE